ncbi:hypothetical protein AQUCO_04800003v1 [Aquilegia coerulea]|uniref:Uncharacterized protein n=1 Tax=Aquilegia coerulea TaxID=218851 RepID=A0A2G5CKL5_AQUCA|nr:hypothetical protein AQUCO_04800003v1 [Aquilegia coerulea]
MLRRTKSMLIEFGTLVLPPLTEITVLDFPDPKFSTCFFHNTFWKNLLAFSEWVFVFLLNRMAPLVSLQKKVYLSILKKELPKLLAFSSGATNQPSLQNIVM